MNQNQNSAARTLGREMTALNPSYLLGFLIVSTTCVFGAVMAFLIVVNRPFPAFRPILRVPFDIYITSFPGPLPAPFRLGLGLGDDSLATSRLFHLGQVSPLRFMFFFRSQAARCQYPAHTRLTGCASAAFVVRRNCSPLLMRRLSSRQAISAA